MAAVPQICSGLHRKLTAQRNGTVVGCSDAQDTGNGVSRRRQSFTRTDATRVTCNRGGFPVLFGTIDVQLWGTSIDSRVLHYT